MTPADLYRECRVSAWRLETMQHYAASGDGDEDRQRAFRTGEPLPPPGRGKQADLELIAMLRESGRQIGRVHVVDQPLTPYVRYELAVYAENASAGEEVRIADRSVHPELEALTRDFAIFDAEASDAAVILFDYDDDGRVRGYRVADDPETVGHCREQYSLALHLSVPLAEFTAATLTVPGR
jgi:Family of unknown function (DUF6879)